VQPGRIIHMDRRTLGDERLREDGVLESTLALIHRILSGGEGVILKGIIPGKSLEITNEATFDSLYQATLSLAFDDPLPPNTSEASEAVTIVSALPDWDLLEESFWQGHSEWQLAAVLEGMEERKREKVVTTIEELQRKGVNITMIDRGDRFWLEK
jgi:predicted transcriptional regulator